jgi:hypothetical protein
MAASKSGAPEKIPRSVALTPTANPASRRLVPSDGEDTEPDAEQGRDHSLAHDEQLDRAGAADYIMTWRMPANAPVYGRIIRLYDQILANGPIRLFLRRGGVGAPRRTPEAMGAPGSRRPPESAISPSANPGS